MPFYQQSRERLCRIVQGRSWNGGAAFCYPAPVSRHPKLANFALVLLFTALSLGAAEWIFRAFERHWLVPELPSVTDDGPIDLAKLRYNDGVVRRDTAENEFRVLSFGDSFAYSVMEPSLSYNGVLERRLDDALDDRDVRVVNLGEPATGIRNFLESHAFWSGLLEHDAVVFHLFLGNDILDDAYLYTPMDWSPNVGIIEERNPILAAGNPRVPRKFPLRMLDYGWAWWMSVRSGTEEALPEGYNWAATTDFGEDDFLDINATYLRNFDPDRLPELMPGYEQAALLFRRAADIAASGRRVVVVLGPAQPQVDEDLLTKALQAADLRRAQVDLGLAARILERLRDHLAPDVQLLDLTLPFRRAHRDTGEGLYFRNNTHWDRAGNRLAGDVLADALLVDWFDTAGQVDAGLLRHPDGNVLLDAGAIDERLSTVMDMVAGDRPRISGALRAIQLMDGVADDPGNWAIAPLGQPITVTFPRPVSADGLRLHLVQSDGRAYRLTVEVESDGGWRMAADLRDRFVDGTLDIALDGSAISAIRIIGTDSNDLERNPGNAYIHLRELEIVKSTGTRPQ